MLSYAAKRLAQAVITLVLLAVLMFFLSRVLGDPTLFLLPLDSSGDDIERAAERLGLNRPLFEQFLAYFGDLLRGDFGVSIRRQVPVIDLIGTTLWATVQLVVVAMVWATGAAVLLGVAAAVWHGRAADTAARFLAVIGQSAPSFWVGIMLIQLFSVELEVLPTAGYGGWATFVMPAFTLGLFAIAGMARLLRSSMIEALGADYVRKARVMGVRGRSIVWKHAFRNASLPVLTYAAEYVAVLITAAVVVETIFAWPGVGRLAYEAVSTRDFPLIQGITLVVAALTLGLNLTVDLVYGLIDPRIRYA